MAKLKKFLIVSLLLLFSGCTSTINSDTDKVNTFRLTGLIRGEVYTDYIYLSYPGYEDSTLVVNNLFEFTGSVNKPVQGWINLKPSANIEFIYLENSDINLEATHKITERNKEPFNVLEIENIEGSYSAKIQDEFRNFYKENNSKENFDSLLFIKLDSYLEQNKTHPFSGNILGHLALIDPILSQQQLLELYSKLDTSYMDKRDMDEFKLGIEKMNQYGAGNLFPEFSLNDTDDKTFDASALRGKIVFVDFWASWCKPCREKHPELIALYNNYNTRDFEIVSVSIDTNKDNWNKAIQKDNLPWINLLDQEKKLTNELGIIAVPYNYLIDANGTVLGVNFSMEHIEKILNQHFNN